MSILLGINLASFVVKVKLPRVKFSIHVIYIFKNTTAKEDG